MRRQIALSDVSQVPAGSRHLATSGKAAGKAESHGPITLARIEPAPSSYTQIGGNHCTTNAVSPSRAKPLVLLAGETGIISLLKYIVEDNGYTCLLADNLSAAPAVAAAERPDLIALDVLQPQGCIVAIRQRLYQNRNTRRVPVLIMSATAVHPGQLTSLFVEPENVILKPFLPEAFLERVQGLLRQTLPSTNSSVLRFADIIMELEVHRVYRGRRAISLAPIEYRILRQLLEHPRKVLTRDRLLATAQDEADATPRSIDVHISRIRKALSGHGEPNPIRTVRGIGYSVDEAPENLLARSRSVRGDR